jgi:arylsulfatase A-like enzyme
MKYFDPTAVVLFFVVSLAGIVQHSFLLQLNSDWSERMFQAYALGVGYDVMNGAIFSTLAVISPFPILFRKIFFSILGLGLFAFLFTDYHYVLIFGTHLPFSTIEYLNDSGAFLSSAIHAVNDKTFWMLFVFPSVMLVFMLWRFGKKLNSWKEDFKCRALTLLFIILIGGAAASYSNSYVSKNMENPLTSAALQYFYYSKDRESDKKTSEKIWDNYPLVRVREATGCTGQNYSELTKILCATADKPNILILFLESFRAAEVGVYGSKLGLTPEFDRWSKHGILYKNFFANGFQTRHGQVATYCSLFPNYGAAVMKRYTRNSFMCLPEYLKNLGYYTSWVYGSDANFDGQSTFLPKIGFDKIVDEFDFPNGAVTLGWGLSDEDLFRKWETVLDSEKEPFFSSALTSTNHYPFEVPDNYRLQAGDSVTDRYRESLHYTDAMLGVFLKRISKKPWFKNTIIFVTADTSSYQNAEQNTNNYEEFVNLHSQVPLLILSGKSIALGKKSEGIIITQHASQVDLAPTILDILRKKYIVPWVGRSLLNSVDLLTDVPQRAYTNRPGAYWAVIEEKSRYYRENDKRDHFFGDQDNQKGLHLKEIGSSWIKTISWVLQENRVWPEK